MQLAASDRGDRSVTAKKSIKVLTALWYQRTMPGGVKWSKVASTTRIRFETSAKAEASLLNSGISLSATRQLPARPIQGPVKVPTLFRRYVEKYGSALYVTSLTGECVRIYPMPEWESIEQRLSLLPSMDPARRKFLDRTNYYGQQSTMDTQGRVLIHPLLRTSAQVVGDVAVLGYLSYLEVWELDRFQQRLLRILTREDEAAIARLGI